MTYEQVVQMVRRRLGPLWENAGKKAFGDILLEELRSNGLTKDDAPSNPWRHIQGDCHQN